MYYLQFPTSTERFLAYVDYLQENNVDCNRIFNGIDKLIEKYHFRCDSVTHSLNICYDGYTHTHWVGLFLSHPLGGIPFPEIYKKTSIYSIF